MRNTYARACTRGHICAQSTAHYGSCSVCHSSVAHDGSYYYRVCHRVTHDGSYYCSVCHSSFTHDGRYYYSVCLCKSNPPGDAHFSLPVLPGDARDESGRLVGDAISWWRRRCGCSPIARLRAKRYKIITLRCKALQNRHSPVRHINVTPPPARIKSQRIAKC
eukprot:3931096-Pyramimonas_sp.AAC.1